VHPRSQEDLGAPLTQEHTATLRRQADLPKGPLGEDLSDLLRQVDQELSGIEELNRSSEAPDPVLARSERSKRKAVLEDDGALVERNLM